MEEDVPSPCLKICVYEAAIGQCRGCYRTLAEIATWSEQTAAQRRATLAACNRRRLKN